MTSVQGTLLSKIQSRTAKAGVIGLGYVGLPLAVEFAKAGFATVWDRRGCAEGGGHPGRQVLHRRRARV